VVRVVVLLLLSMLAHSTGAAQIKVTGIYSNLEYLKEAGDVGGVEVFIVYAAGPGDAKSGYYAMMQCAEGVPGKPVLVPATVAGNRIELAAHSDSESYCPRAKFKGSVSTKGLKGGFEGEGGAIWLPRKRSYWQ
jgi:hypothetical protein